jgi:hypothetical protein
VSISARDRATLRRARKIRRRERERRRASSLRLVPLGSLLKGPEPLVRLRDPRLRDATYLAWLRRQPCIACWAGLLEGGGPIEASHPKFGLGARRREFGIGEKSHDRFALPLCQSHHRTGLLAEHRGQRRFWDRLGVDVADFALDLNTAFDADQGGEDVVLIYARRASRCIRSTR